MFRPGPPRDRIELPSRFGFLDFEVDVAAIRVTRTGAELPLEPRAFDLLLLLAANPGRVLEKEEIFERLWPGVVVGDNALTRVVAHLRHELGDSAEQARVVETVRTRGYRFLPVVHALETAAVETPLRESVRGSAEGTAAASPPVPPERRRIGLLAAVLVATVGAAVVATVFWRARQERFSEGAQSWTPTPVQRTVEAGYRGDADLSPDGSELVYSSDAAGGLELFVRPVEGGREIRITSGGGPKVEPAWSPDGRFIAYRDHGRGGIWVVAPTGGPARQLCDFGSQPAWFPDSERLVFAAPGRATIGALESPAAYASSLWTVELGSGRTRQLTRPDPEAGGQGMPAVAADGRSVYFATARFIGGSALWRIAADGGVPERLTPTESAEPNSQGLDSWLDPTPTPDGKWLLAIQVDAVRRIVRLSLDGSGRIEPVLDAAPEGVGGLALSRTGRRLVYTDQRNRTTLEEIELRPDGAVSGSPRILAAPVTQRVLLPSYSPDGSLCVFQRRRSGVGAELMVLDRTTGETRTLSTEREFGFVWTGPTRIALGAPDFGVELDLATGRRVERPRPAGSDQLLAMAEPRPTVRTPDGRHLAFSATGEGGARELFLGDLESGAARQLTRLGGAVDYPFVSRDGRWIGFQLLKSAADMGNELWRIRAAGGEPERLPTGRGPSWGGAFAPDDETVVYAAHRQGSWHLALAGEERPERLLDVAPETAGYLRWPDWSPDGRHIAYERMHYSANLWTLDLPPSP